MESSRRGADRAVASRDPLASSVTLAWLTLPLTLGMLLECRLDDLPGNPVVRLAESFHSRWKVKEAAVGSELQNAENSGDRNASLRGDPTSFLVVEKNPALGLDRKTHSVPFTTRKRDIGVN